MEMIRTMPSNEIGAIAAIWLDTNLKAHDFIPPLYWKDHYEMVKGMLAEAELKRIRKEYQGLCVL
ncbi:hypothetical protein [Enterocloster sp.]|uniref:hypothetical protein n=1 Tax=Enterocloster sp. TaxID=2719315 RepID=UPI003991E661